MKMQIYAEFYCKSDPGDSLFLFFLVQVCHGTVMRYKKKTKQPDALKVTDLSQMFVTLLFYDIDNK